MRMLHTSDWHIGKVTVREPRRADHEAAFQSLVEVTKEFSPDLILHTGDLFDGSRPGYDDMLRAVEMLQQLSAQAHVVVLCGNHDSGALFRLFGQILGPDGRITFVDTLRPPSEGGILEFPISDGTRLLLGALPFIHANRFVKYFVDPEEQMVTYADRIRLYEKLLGQALEDRREPGRDVAVFAAHVYVGGSVKSGSERRLHISDEYATRAESIPPANYAAFGHIHKPQALPGTTVGWYAGSMLQMDFGEMGEQKGVVLVEATPGRSTHATFTPLPCGRELRVFSGTLSELQSVASDYAGSLCRATIQTETPTPQLPEIVTSILGNATVVEVNEDCWATRLDVVEAVEADREPTYNELFREFVSAVGTKGAPADLVADSFDSLLNAAQTQQPPRFAGLDDEETRHEAATS